MKPALMIGAVMMSALLSACSGGGNLGNNTQIIDIPVSEGAYQMLCGQVAQASDPVKAQYGCENI